MADRFNVARRVHQGKFPIAGRQRLTQAHLRKGLGQGLAQQAVLGHGKPVPVGQRQHEMVGVEGLHARYCAEKFFAALQQKCLQFQTQSL